MKKSKNYRGALEKIDKTKLYEVKEALQLVKDLSKEKFDATVEVAVRLGVDPKKNDQQVRGVVVLPHGTGKSKKVLVLAKGAKQEEAKKAGADFVGEMELIEKIEKENWFDFDLIVATPEMMPSLGKIAKILGPKGLMPNPKTRTVSEDIQGIVEDIKKGQVEYRADASGIVHNAIGKVSFKTEDLAENFVSYMEAIMKAKPTSLKGDYLKTITVSSTMGVGIKINTSNYL